MISKNKPLIVSTPSNFEKIVMDDRDRILLLSTPLYYLENFVRVCPTGFLKIPISETNVVVELEKLEKSSNSSRRFLISINDTGEKALCGKLEIPHSILPFGAMTIEKLGQQFSRFIQKDENRRNMDFFVRFLLSGRDGQRFFPVEPAPGEKLKIFKENGNDDGMIVNGEKNLSSVAGMEVKYTIKVRFEEEFIALKIKKGDSFGSILLSPDYCRSVSKSGIETRLKIILEMSRGDSPRNENWSFDFLEKFERTIGPLPDKKLAGVLPVLLKAGGNFDFPSLYVGELSGRKHLFYQEAGTDSEISVIASQFDKGKESQQLLEFCGKLILSKGFPETPLSRFVPGLDSRGEER